MWLIYVVSAAGSAVDLKKTSYKKLSKLLAVFEKRGVLSQKHVHKQEHVSSVHRGHALYTAFAGNAGAAAAAGVRSQASGLHCEEGGSCATEMASARCMSSTRV